MMTEETLDMRDDDRLPWLEAVDEDDGDSVGLGRLLLLVLGGLAVVAVVIGLFVFLNSRGHRADEGNGELIAAPEGDYRVRPDDAGGMQVEGEGDAAFATSEGDSPDGRVDPTAVPEQPVQGRRVAATAGENSSNDARGNPSGSASARIPPSSERLAAQDRPSPTAASSQASASSGRLIQLGAYSSEASANSAWQALAGRYDYLGSLEKNVSTVQAGGRTLYRLRAAAGSADAARQVCNRLRVATEDCSVVVN